MSSKIDFIGIGTAKSATTTIAFLLDEHPEICLSIPKEIHFFNKQGDTNSKELMDSYMHHFKHCPTNSIKGEFSPQYFARYDYTPKKIYEAFPNVKLLLCIRNPTDRLYSYFQMRENRSIPNEASFSHKIRTDSSYVDGSLYYKHLSRYLNFFDRKNILVLTFEQIKEHPIKTIQGVYSFLGVDSSYIPSNPFLKANKSIQTRFKFLNSFERWFVKTLGKLGGGKIIQWLKAKNIHKMYQSLYTRPYSYPPMKETDCQWLKQQFASDIKQLEQLLEQDFSHWK